MHNIPPAVDKWQYTWTYTDKDGNPTGQVRRTTDKKITQWKPDGQGGWISGGAFKDQPKPLYNLLELLERELAPVLMVEGEKTADAAKSLFPDMVVISWFGGTGSASKIDLEPLEGRNVILWPDNDEVGKKAMHTIAQRLLREGAASVKMVDTSAYDLPKGWDLADDGLLDYEIEELIQNAKEVRLVDDKHNAIRESRTVADKPNPLNLRRSEKNNPLNKSENVKAILDHLNIKIRFNEMTKRAEFIKPEYLENKLIEGVIYDECVEHRVPIVNLHGHLDTLAQDCAFHPAREWIDSKPWDGVNRWEDLLKTVHTNDELFPALLYKWLLSAVAVLYSKTPVRAEGVLVFQGPQGCGKTRWFGALCPLAFQSDGMVLDLNNKDSLISVTSTWLVELGEIGGTYKKSDMDLLKAFFSKKIDRYRLPYARADILAPRRTVFFGSVNDSRLLYDKTGNRRWWGVEVSKLDYEHQIDMQQLWAEIKVGYEEGASWHLESHQQDALAKHNERFEIIEPITERILNMYNFESSFREWKNATAVAIELGITNPTVGDIIKIGRALTELKIPSNESKKHPKYFMPRK